MRASRRAVVAGGVCMTAVRAGGWARTRPRRRSAGRARRAREERAAIDIAPLQGALRQFETSLRHLESEASGNDLELRVQFRASTIQAFELTYELTVKMIVRQAAALLASPDEIKRQGFMDQMRAAARDPRRARSARRRARLRPSTTWSCAWT
jgi:hypothetical protein